LPDNQILRWLQHGASLALREKGEAASHRDVIWKLIEDAIESINKLPDQERRWLSSGTRSGGWGQVGEEARDIRELEKNRVLSGMKIADGDATYSPQSADIDRAMGVLEWLNALHQHRNGDRLKKAAVLLASKGDTDAVAKVFSPNRKPGRRMVYEIRSMATSIILAHLKNIGIFPAGRVDFRT